MIETSPTIGAIAAAIAVAQAEMHNAFLGSVNPHFQSKYANFAAVRAACLPAFTAQKIAVLQAVETTTEGAVQVTTMLAHASGEWVRSTASLRPDKPGAHAYGSAVTYLRRYTLQAIACQAADEDDDGNESSPAPEEKKDAPKRGRATDDTSDTKERQRVLVARLTNLYPLGLGMTQADAVKWIVENFKPAKATHEMTAVQLDNAIEAASRLLAQKAQKVGVGPAK